MQFSYGMNGKFDHHRKITKIPKPSGKVLIADSRSDGNKKNSWGLLGTTASTTLKLWPWHGNMANVTFSDGHLESLGGVGTDIAASEYIYNLPLKSTGNAADCPWTL